MTDRGLIKAYNYDSFVPEKYERWLNFDSSLPLGKIIPDFTLWDLHKEETTLLTEVNRHPLTFIEFGSFT
jgi:hypothetical protein